MFQPLIFQGVQPGKSTNIQITQISKENHINQTSIFGVPCSCSKVYILERRAIIKMLMLQNEGIMATTGPGGVWSFYFESQIHTEQDT